MSGDSLPHAFAPIHLVRTDLPRVECHGKFYKLDDALLTLDFTRRIDPEGTYALLNDGGLIDDSKIERRISASYARLSALAATLSLPESQRLPTLRLLRKIA